MYFCCLSILFRPAFHLVLDEWTFSLRWWCLLCSTTPISICFNFVWSLFLIYSRFHMTNKTDYFALATIIFFFYFLLFFVHPVILRFPRYLLLSFDFKTKGRKIFVEIESGKLMTVDKRFCKFNLAIANSWKCHLMPITKLAFFTVKIHFEWLLSFVFGRLL